MALPLTILPDLLMLAFLVQPKEEPRGCHTPPPGFEYQFSWSCGSCPEPLYLSPAAQQPPSSARHRQGRRCNGGLCVRGPLSLSGVLMADSPRATLLLPGWRAVQGQARRYAPQTARGCPPRLPSPSLVPANHSSLFLSSPPTWPPCLPGDIRHPSEHLRSLAFALWPSNSSFSSAAASPQFSATGSTPSHKKTDLPGRHLPFVQTMRGVPRGWAGLGAPEGQLGL